MFDVKFTGKVFLERLLRACCLHGSSRIFGYTGIFSCVHCLIGGTRLWGDDIFCILYIIIRFGIQD